MFTPNLVGSLRVATGRDVHGRKKLSSSGHCPFAFVSGKRSSGKTAVRADSSASRGSADEISSERNVILVPSHMNIKIGDIFTYAGASSEITSIHPRHSVTGEMDHWECGMEVYAE
jgi:hypothetical protein